MHRRYCWKLTDRSPLFRVKVGCINMTESVASLVRATLLLKRLYGPSIWNTLAEVGRQTRQPFTRANPQLA